MSLEIPLNPPLTVKNNSVQSKKSRKIAEEVETEIRGYGKSLISLPEVWDQQWTWRSSAALCSATTSQIGASSSVPRNRSLI